MLRKIIAEEVSKTKTKKTLSEAITRITEDEMAAWKGGNWGYVAGDEQEPAVDFDDDDRFLHGSEHGEAVDDEGYMAKSQLASMKEMAYEVCELLDGDDQLPGWVQNHLAVAHENLQQVHGYLMGDAKMQAYEEEEEHGMHAEAKKRKKSGKKNTLWGNIQAKKERGEAPAKPGDPDRPSKKAWDAAVKASK